MVDEMTLGLTRNIIFATVVGSLLL